MDTCSRLEEPGGVDGNTSTSVVYGRLQAASGRSGGFERPFDWVGGQGTWPARFRVAALGGTAWGRARADGGGAAPHNAGDAAAGGPCGRDRPFATRERAAAHGARHFRKIDRDLCWDTDMRFRFIEDRRADYPVTTDSRHDLPIAPNLLDRNFTATAPNPDLARRYYLCRDRSGLALSGHGPGPLQPKDRRLGNVRSLACRPAVGSLADGHLGAAAGCRPDPPFRSRRSICLGGVSQSDAVRRLQALDEPQSGLL